MNTILRLGLAVAGLAIATQAAAQITFYEREGFAGRSFTTDRPVGNFDRFGFNDRASSVVVQRDRWEVCDQPGFRGQCVILRPGQYPSLAAMGMNNSASSVRAVGSVGRSDESYVPAPMPAQITFYEREGFAGRSFTTDRLVSNFERFGFNDRASSVVVERGQWEVCENAGFNGRCVILQPGQYPSLAAMGMNNSASSVRAISRGDESYVPAAMPARITFYEREGFVGRSFTTDRRIGDFERFGFNDRASSVVVERGQWEVCEHAAFNGRCVILRPGQYPSLAAMGLNNRITSVRSVVG